MDGNPPRLEEEVERIEQVVGRLMRAVRLLSGIGYSTPAQSCLRLMEEAEYIVDDIDWERLRMTIEFYCEDSENDG